MKQPVMGPDEVSQQVGAAAAKNQSINLSFMNFAYTS